MTAETTKKKVTFEPTILYVHSENEGDWEFRKYYRTGNVPTWDDFIIHSMGGYSGKEDITWRFPGISNEDIRYVAIHRDGKWSSARAVNQNTGRMIQIQVLEEDQRLIDKIAFPIDKRMKQVDIDGAVNIYPNETNTGWLFEHAPVEDHHDRMFSAETAMSTIFEELLHDKLSTLLVSFIQGHSKSNQLGEAAVLEHIENFRDDCKKMTRYREGQLYIGEHVQNPGEHYIYKMVQEAFKLAKKKWSVEKSAELNQISDDIAPIEKRLNSRHNFKRRWEIPTVFPDAQTQTSAEENSEE